MNRLRKLTIYVSFGRANFILNNILNKEHPPKNVCVSLPTIVTKSKKKSIQELFKDYLG